GNEKPCISFGPLSVLPAYQRKGYGKALLEHSFGAAREMGYDVIVIYGDPDNYISIGFKSCKKYNVCADENCFPAALLVKELADGALDGRRWFFRESSFDEALSDDEAVAAFDSSFPHKEKTWRPSQEAFYIMSHSVIG
ncbi:MAG: N-acetyltransferase, partial [Clostridia bacterium]|nr:N-acetyltransferase [Clostridia bacterium]